MRSAGGGSFAVRQLYTDDEEVLFQATRPILLNGIDDVISRPDLADRALFLTLLPIDGDRRPSFGGNSRSRARASWGLCLTRRRMGCGH
jgi:hypothetical protein